MELGHRDESLTLSVRPLVDKLGGAMSNWLVSTIAVAAGMTTGASASQQLQHINSLSLSLACLVSQQQQCSSVPSLLLVNHFD